jgi:hypothetical protein
MADPLIPRPLSRDQVAQAFPLVQAILPGTSLARWTDFARRHTLERGERGIMTVQNQTGYILGLFTHEVQDELSLGRALVANNIMVADFPGREQTLNALIDAMQMLANLRRCAAISAALDSAAGVAPPGTWVLSRFLEAGFLASGPRQCHKSLTPARDPLARAAPVASRSA